MNKIIQKLIKRKTSVFRLVLLVFLALCISGFIISEYPVIETQYPIIDNTHWICEKDLENQTITYKRTITSNILNKSILFYAENAYVDILIGNKNKYHFGTKSNITKTPGTTWTIYHISDESVINQDIEIQIQYVYHIPKETTTIYIGNSSTLSLSKIKTELPDILLNIMILSVSSLFIFCYIQSRKYKYDKKANRRNFCYGLLGFFLLSMSGSTLFSTQLIFPNGLGQYYLCYLSFLIIPLTSLLYIESYVKNNLNYEFLSNLFCIFIVVFLQIFNIKDFVEIIPIYCIYVLIEFLIVYRKIHKTCKTSRKPLLIFEFSFFLFFCILSCYICNILPINKMKLMFIIKVVFLLFVKLELFIYIKKKITDSKHMYHNAYIDSMTGIGNRNLLYRNLNRYKLEKTSVVFLDINNLKYCNDTYGHNYGDILIKNAANLICEIYGDDNVYRIGGDEFVVLQHNTSEAQLTILRNILFKKMKEYNSSATINKAPYLEIACGFSSYQKGDKKYDDIIDRADKVMYENKIYVKSKYNNKQE